MATPARQAVLDDVNTTLAYLKLGLIPSRVSDGGGGGPAKVKITTLERCLKIWSEVGANEFPWMGFGQVTEDYEYEQGGQITVALLFTILAHVASSPTTLDQITADISGVIDDVIAALNADTMRSKNARDTTIVSTASTEGDAQPNDSRGCMGSVEIKVRIKYPRTMGAT